MCATTVRQEVVKVMRHIYILHALYIIYYMVIDTYHVCVHVFVCVCVCVCVEREGGREGEREREGGRERERERLYTINYVYVCCILISILVCIHWIQDHGHFPVVKAFISRRLWHATLLIMHVHVICIG